MLGIRTRRDTLTPRDVERLGEFDNHWFVKYERDEFMLGSAPMAPFEVAEPIREDEIRIREPYTKDVLGTPEHGTHTVRGRRVPTGTFEAYRAREQEKTRLRERGQEQRPVDLLGVVGRRMPMVIGGFLADRVPPARGPEAIIAWAKGHGIELSLTAGGRLLVRGKAGHLLDDHRRVLATAERLIVGHLTGHPVLCELSHGGDTPPAVTVLALDVPACEEHAK